MSRRNLKINNSPIKLYRALAPTHEDPDVRVDRRETNRARDVLIALARLLARHAARDFVSQE